MGSQPGAGSGTPKWEMSGNPHSLTPTGTKPEACQVMIESFPAGTQRYYDRLHAA